MNNTKVVAVSGVSGAGKTTIVKQLANKFDCPLDKNEAELLEKTLNYFNQGTQARTIGISLVEGAN